MTKSEEQQRQQRRVEMHNVYVARGETISPAFAELRTARILAEIHFGRPAADAMGVPFQGRHQVFAAVSGLYGGTFADPYFPSAELAEQHRQFEVSMRQLLSEHRAEDGTPDETDKPTNRRSTYDVGKHLPAVLGGPIVADNAAAGRRSGARSAETPGQRGPLRAVGNPQLVQRP